MNFDYPTPTTGEITIIGTGGGYGEGCLIHLGMKNWIVVDSCINPYTKSSLPLEYLRKINVDLHNDVKLIVCSHWHDDHIGGISQIVEECDNALFSCAKTTDLNKLMRLLRLDYNKENVSSISSTLEFNKCIESIENKQQILSSAYQDKLLYQFNFANTCCNKVYSLSPSEQATLDFDLEILSKFDEIAKTNRGIILSHNLKSVALLLTMGSHEIILGADLEYIHNNDRIGWGAIISKSQAVINSKFSYIKIPHHGSENGFCENLWTKFLCINPEATITPFNRLQVPLPTEIMQNLYKSKTNKLFITSQNKAFKRKKRDPETKKIIKDWELKINLEEVPYQYGLIRSRIDINNPDATWITECDGTAFQL